MTNTVIEGLRACGDWMLIHIWDRGMRTTGAGLLLPDDDGVSGGIRPRWAEVLSLGGRAARDSGLAVGDDVLLPHGEWAREWKVGQRRLVDGRNVRISYADWRNVLLYGKMRDEAGKFVVSKVA